MRERIYLNEDWLYEKKFKKELTESTYNSETAVKVRLPHTNVETPFHYFDESIYQFISGYRRILNVPSEWRGKSIILTFDGIAHESDVYVNGEKVAEHHCGYTAFSVDLSDKVDYGKDNVIAVRVNSREDINVPPFGFVIDYMTYGGIYRDAYLEVTDKCHLENLYIAPRVEVKNGESVRASLVGSFEISSEKDADWECEFMICEKNRTDYRSLGRFKANEMEIRLHNGTRIYEKEVKVPYAPKLWSPETPNLYKVKTVLYKNGEIIDMDELKTGFRTAEFRAEGFFLNGKKYTIRGLNRHQSYPYVGYAMPKSMQEMDALVLKNELGVNAARTCHYPQSHYYIDKCDEIGLLIFTEIPGWQHIGDEDWKEQAVRNTRDMILQYRNHTSIILWGVRINESQDDDALYTRTNALAHELDPYRQTGGVRFLKKSNLLEDVYTFNDFSHNGTTPGCTKKDKVTTDMNKGYLITEYNGHMYPTKTFDDEEHRTEHFLRHARVMDAYYGEPGVSGGFGWCFADYNTHQDFGSGDRICYHGVVDMFRNMKPAAAIYASQQDKKPFLYVNSSMDIGEHPAGVRGELWAITNADSIKMYKNDRFISEYPIKNSPFKNMGKGPVMIDDFIGDQMETVEGYKPSIAADLKKGLNMVSAHGMEGAPKKFYAIAAKVLTLDGIKYSRLVELYGKYIGDWGGSVKSYRFDAVKDGQVVASTTKGPVKKVVLEAAPFKCELIEENSYDVTEVRIKAVDQNGNQLFVYNDPVELSIEGDAELIGPSIINLQGGMAGCYIKSLGRNGEATLTVKCQHAEEVKVKFTITV